MKTIISIDLVTGDTYIGMARRFTDNYQVLHSKDEPVLALLRDVMHYAHVHGWQLGGLPKFMRQDNVASCSRGPLALDTWLAVKYKARPVEQTPGYDADGRECWEYPT